MAKVLGVGGVFFKANDTEALSKWYQEVLGIDMGEWGAMFKVTGLPQDGYQVFSLFKADTEYLDTPSHKGVNKFMINFVVEDLPNLIEKVKAAGGEQIDKLVEDEHGRFAWVADPEGNKMELWEPK